MRPLFGRLFGSGTKDNSTQQSLGPKLRLSTAASEVRVGKAGWESSKDNTSTVGFARIHDDYPLSSLELQQQVYQPGGASIHTSAGKGGPDYSSALHPSGIMKEQTIDQKSDIV